MTNVQLLLAILIPTVTVLVGILLSHNGIGHLASRFSSLEQHLSARMSAIESRLTSIEGDLRRFYQILGEHGARIDNLEKQPRG